MVIKSAFLLIILLIGGCQSNKQPYENGQTEQETQLIEEVKSPLGPENIENAPPATIDLEEPEELVRPLPPLGGVLPYPIGGLLWGGGGINTRRALHCEIATEERDCSDNNPCTIDSCVDDHCVHSLDTNKTTFGSCETDGQVCSTGKCVEVNDLIFCYEQPREFIDGEAGCRDDNPCTADSCIALADSENAIEKNDYQCIFELTENALCFAEDVCLPGVCTITGTGDPGSDFAIACIQDVSGTPEAFCPNNSLNICTPATCEVGVGCVTTPVPSGTVCNDNNPCTINDSCEPDPVTQEMTCFGAPKEFLPLDEGGCSHETSCIDDGCSEGICVSTNLSGPVGDYCNTGLLGLCANGNLQCLDGVAQDVCLPVADPGVLPDFCDYNGIDDDCDGVVDECPCPLPTGTIRYVNPNVGQNTGNCSVKESPCATISYAISQSLANDTLDLSTGTFHEQGIFMNVDDLTIIGRGPDFTTIQSNGTDRVFRTGDNLTNTICGVTITGGFRPDCGGCQNGDGAGIFSQADTLNIIQSTITDNEANGGVGGGIYSPFPTRINITDSVISNNKAVAGGGLYLEATATITGTTFDQNIANTAGSAIDVNGGILGVPGRLFLSNSTISNNNSSGPNFNNGAITILGSFSIITNCTISGNIGTGLNTGGGLGSEVSFCTITNNTVSGITAFSGGAVSVGHNIVADQAPGTPDCFFLLGKTLTSSGYNLESGTSCGFNNPNDVQNANADLGPLQDNGGITFTHALGNTSRAINGGITTPCRTPSNTFINADQRGFSRPVEYPSFYPIDMQTRCDIGAVERQLFEQ